MDISLFLPLLMILPILQGHFWFRKNDFVALVMTTLGLGLCFFLLAWTGFSGASIVFNLLPQLEFLDSIGAVGLHWDFLSALVVTTVLLIGSVILRFSVRYLEDDPRQKHFLLNVSFLLTSVLALILSNNLLFYAIMWLFCSYCLHQLLLHFPDRPAAREAANLKFWVSRMGDGFLFTALFCFYQVFSTFHIPSLIDGAKNLESLGDSSYLFQIGCFLFIFGVAAKSAQVPFHYWLPKTMETPTPVSALMHAGVINAGGYLVIRMSSLLALSTGALVLLAFIGTLSCAYASVMMLTQTNVKKSLAYSTIAQMGFMMLQCGLGAFALATLHLVGHALYKAYAFLSSGTLAEWGRLQRYFPKRYTSDARLSRGSVLFAVFWGVSLLSLYAVEMLAIGDWVLFSIFLLAVLQMLLQSQNKMAAVLMTMSIGFLYLGSAFILKVALAGALGEVEFSKLQIGLLGSVSLSFLGLFILQNHLSSLRRTQIGQWLYVRMLQKS